MKRLFVLCLATSAVVGACGDEDDTPSGSGGATAGKAGSSAAGKAGSSAGKGGSSAAGEGGSSPGKGGSSAGKGGAGKGGSTMSAGGASAGESGESGAGGASAGQGGASGADATSERFTVTIENVAPTKLFTSAGVFNTPVGDSSPGAITPGKMYQFTIDAGRKHKLSFATMLAATNDLFFGPDGNGIALYDGNGDPISGDVTDQIHLWDAGTEINEEPKVGPNTVSQQSAPDTGPAENGTVVDIADATSGVSFAYPAVADVIHVSVLHLTGTEFQVTIEDVSAADALKTSLGDFPAPLSPGVWVVHGGVDPLFTVGMPDRGHGIEHIAEDGNPAGLGAFVADNAGLTYPASPGVWVLHTAGTKPLFSAGVADYGDGIEHIAEDGNPTELGGNLGMLSGELGGAVFNTPVGAGGPGPIVPGTRYQFSFDASPGDALSFVTMLAATNDVFFGPGDTGIPLFDGNHQPIAGNVTSQIRLWDAGTEGNEEPGIGPNTVSQQPAADTGTPGEGVVELLSDVNDGYTYPAVSSVLEVTISHE